MQHSNIYPLTYKRTSWFLPGFGNDESKLYKHTRAGFFLWVHLKKKMPLK